MAVATKRGSAPSAGRAGKYAPYERLLRARRTELMKHLREHREEIVTERGPEDEWGLATRTLMEDLAVGTLQREQQLLREVETALARLDRGDYGVCEGCGEDIPERRLQALPWTCFCLKCAEPALLAPREVEGSEAERTPVEVRRHSHWKN